MKLDPPLLVLLVGSLMVIAGLVLGVPYLTTRISAIKNREDRSQIKALKGWDWWATVWLAGGAAICGYAFYLLSS